MSDFFNRDQRPVLNGILNGSINPTELNGNIQRNILQPQLFLFVDKDRKTKWNYNVYSNPVPVPKNLTFLNIAFYSGILLIVLAIVYSAKGSS